jgi:hypothetical protein
MKRISKQPATLFFNYEIHTYGFLSCAGMTEMTERKLSSSLASILFEMCFSCPELFFRAVLHTECKNLKM